MNAINSFGLSSGESTSSEVNALALKAEANKLEGIVGKMVYLDITVDEELYRAIGTVTDIKTSNSLLQSSSVQSVTADGRYQPPSQKHDLRTFTFKIQATFKLGKDGIWSGNSSALPTSPSTGEHIKLLTEDVVGEMLNTTGFPTTGYFRGMDNTPNPLLIPNFGGKTGATHSAVIGQSGSGKDLALDTPIPTPTGWTTMGELKNGDFVLSEYGTPVEVLKVHEILTNSRCYRFIFDDGSELTAGSGHLWPVLTQANIRETKTRKFSPNEISILRKMADQTEQIIVSISDLETIIEYIALEANYINVSREYLEEVISKPEFKKLYDKETLTLKLSEVLNYIAYQGSISTINGMVETTKTTDEILSKITTVPHYIKLTQPTPYVDTDGAIYTTEDEKLELLKVLSNGAGFSLKDGNIKVEDHARANRILKLLRSNGSHATLSHVRATSVTLEWKQETYKRIVSINKVDTVPTRCITVNSQTALYLAGDAYTVTHNTAYYTYMLGTYMCHEEHAIIVIDPQGQWSNENGMVMSLQNFAKGLGRDVNILRVAEDIQLPMEEEIFSKMLSKLRLWSKFRRMGGENLAAFSEIVSSRIARQNDFNGNPRELLSGVFSKIANSKNTLARIYTKGERQDDFRRELLMLAGEPIIDPETDEQEILDQEDLDDVEENWENILSIFTPLINLFSNKNLNGTKRRPLGGPTGFLKDILKIRKENETAPYVVLDMSPNINLNAKKSLLQDSNMQVNMQKVLDNDDVKALMLMMVLSETKNSSEIAFQQGGGNLNTQIVFDEAWRYAPEKSDNPEINALAKMLEGFALDTRKFGIGWSYILQSPGDLRQGIWKQLSYVYAGFGLAGEDIQRLERRTDDKAQINLYRQFIPPKSTGIYPFMLMGPISPIIFTTSPSFINVFSTTEEFLEHNMQWISRLTKKNSLPTLTVDYLRQSLTKKEKFDENAENTKKESYTIGKTSPKVESETAGKIENTFFDGNDDEPDDNAAIKLPF